MRAALPMLMILAACRHIEEAEVDTDDPLGTLDGVMHDWWAGWDGDDANRASAATNSATVTAVATVDVPADGRLSDLAADDLATVGMEDRDPSLGTGMYLLNRFPCALDVLTRTVIALNQDELYDGAYDSYDRTYTGDPDAFLAGGPSLSWDIALASSYIGASFTEQLKGEIRRIPDVDGLGDVLIQRTWMPVPAVFEEGSNKTFDQDYQVEVYWESAPGTIAHQYAIWRQIDMGGGVDNDSDLLLGITLDNLAKFDDGTAGICAAGGP